MKVLIEFHYIYSWWDPRTGLPIYIGKGTQGPSFFAKFSRAHRIANKRSNQFGKNDFLKKVCEKIWADGLEVEVEIKSELYSDADKAYAEEIRLIRLIGRRDLGTGPLCNLTNGGIADARSLNPKSIRDMDKKIRENSLKQWADAKTREKIMAKRNSAKGKKQIGITVKALWKDPEYRANQLTSRAEKDSYHKHWNKPEARSEQAEAMRQRWSKPAEIKKQRKRLIEIWKSPGERAKRVDSFKKAQQIVAIKRQMAYLHNVWGLDIDISRITV